MFNLNQDTVSDSATIANSIYQSYYPNGEQVVKNTSYYSKEFGNQLTRERSLTSRSLADALSGDVLYRSPKFSTTFYNKGLSSSLNSLLTGGSEAAFASVNTYKIDNPENIDGVEGSSATLTGGAAFSRIVSDGISGRNAGAEFVSRAAKSIGTDYSTSKSYPALSSGQTETDTGDDSPTTTTPTPVGGNPTGGAREIVLDASISEQEKGWLLERAKKLQDLPVVSNTKSALTGGFTFDIPNGITDISTTKSYFPGITNMTSVSSSLINAASQKAYVCPAMIELLIYLSTKIYIRGGLGTHRGDGSGMGQGPNGSTLQSGSSMSDHPFGRAFDIIELGSLDGTTVINLASEGADPAKHQKALDFLLAALNSAPTHLIPDLLGMSPDIAATLGVEGSGLESASSKVKQQYPGLVYLNIYPDGNHRLHIHISFSAARSGIYTGPGGRMGGSTTQGSADTNARTASASRERVASVPTPDGTGATTTTSPGVDTSTTSTITQAGQNFLSFIREIRSNNPFAPRASTATLTNPDGTTGTTAPGDYVVPSNLNDPKFTKDYSTDRTATLDIADIFALLRLTVLSDEAAALFAAIAKREGGFRPGAHLCLDSSGDWSFGLWGINMLPNANGTKSYSTPSPSAKTALGWQLAYKDWQSDDIDASNFRRKAFQKLASIGGRNEAWKLWDPVVWVPLNQAYILATVITGKPFDGAKLGQVAESGYLFFPWGDYGGGPTWGWISNVDFSTAAQLYATTGKSEDQLKDWVVKMFQNSGSGSKSAPYGAKWVEGWKYTVKWDSGWTDATVVAPS